MPFDLPFCRPRIMDCMLSGCVAWCGYVRLPAVSHFGARGNINKPDHLGRGWDAKMPALRGGRRGQRSLRIALTGSRPASVPLVAVRAYRLHYNAKSPLLSGAAGEAVYDLSTLEASRAARCRSVAL